MLDGMLSSTYTVGPSTKTNSMSSPASRILTVDSHLTPLCSPENADSTKAALSAPMMMSCTVTVSGAPAVSCKPFATCNAPRPRLVAVPKTVANTASRSMACPAHPCARRSPSNGTKAADNRLPRPFRKPA
ncbi:hypothetical protein NONI108955_43065 [Nocardia ninae]